MNLLLDGLPTRIIDVNGTLYYDTEDLSDDDLDYDGDCPVYDIATGFRNIIKIMIMYEQAQLSDIDKTLCALRMFYLGNVPQDLEAAAKKAITFLDYGAHAEVGDAEKDKRRNKYGRLYSWEQDGNLIYAAINASHDDILKKEPNLHWWEFMNKFQELKEDTKFNDVVLNRLAFKKKKLTKEQATARKEFPEIYVLRQQRKNDIEARNVALEVEKLLNS